MTELAAINWPGFFAVLVLAYLTPGPEFLIVLRSATRGWRAGLAAGAGAQTGLTVHMLIATLGLSLLLTRYPSALLTIQLAGSLYLGYLGWRLLRSAGTEAGPRPSTATAFRQGLATDLLNPKVVVFFAAVLPQFVNLSAGRVREQMLLLGVVDVLFGFLAWLLVTAVGVRLNTWLADPAHRRHWDRVGGALLLAVAITLAVSGMFRW
ncbi:LysE family translocator [Enemella evansiae]|uniref:LysE family translocator n=1 Tax=Enemella evansiae TaxID=2016499 RepID=UPI0010F02269|nr:LysE family translocator [Enemella evansiae]TDO91689.1 threonine/homoserine/homoserine lactone efflux protein [Enemella evansiae]